jgi:hypothetical protein
MRIPIPGELWKDEHNKTLLITMVRTDHPVSHDWIFYYIVDYDIDSNCSLASFVKYSTLVSG